MASDTNHNEAANGSRFPDKLVVKVPEGLREALDRASRAGHQTASEYTRQALLARLESDGEKLPRVEVVAV